MSYIHSKSSSSPANIFYEDWGHGNPVVFIHGWPLSHEMWEYQLTELPKHGLRCIAYDRRGFGKSSKPWSGYDYNTLAGDLKAVLDELDLHNVTLVGFSMGGGEVARYFGQYGGERVSKVVLVGSVTPYLLKTDDNQSGVDVSVFDEMLKNLNEDRAGFLSDFGKQFFGVNLISKPVSQPMLQWNNTLAMLGSPKATLDCVHSFSATDFRNDLSLINVPALVIHGNSDKVVPIEASGDRTSKLINKAIYKVYEGAPHGLYYTQKDQLNQDLLDFIK